MMPANSTVVTGGVKGKTLITRLGEIPGIMKRHKKEIVLGAVWGLVSGLLFFIFPEQFGISQSFSIWLFILKLVKMLIILPLYLSSSICSLFVEPGLSVAPLYTLVSVIMGGLIGAVVGFLRDKFGTVKVSPQVVRSQVVR